ncbi:hypothetical protein PYS58_11645 [Chryseobacterium indologenes]|uniref:hypothetical protein n=1 Tax=Chryseobacterium TaxID=59732 RepID=UPI00162733F5|nr:MULTISPECIES: hypothetical protein [Chryseobacterium]MDM1554613.1 hypothetical protein [Chryseobacterium indologenes]WET51774.1 hypothetical protein PYS58_11645 [Chryseobacterium indologenes]
MSKNLFPADFTYLQGVTREICVISSISESLVPADLTDNADCIFKRKDQST